jgi:hypothetical protein
MADSGKFPQMSLKALVIVAVHETSLGQFRTRQKQPGIVRLEVQVRKDDAVLMRNIAKALADPDREDEVRRLLTARFGAPAAVGLKALLAAAPLEGIDLERPQDMGRALSL